MSAKAAAGIGLGLAAFAALLWALFDLLIWLAAHLQILWGP